MHSIAIFAPAKINLFLAVTGRRPDGYHDLVSVAAPLDFGDTLHFEPAAEGWQLESDVADLPCDDSNLILKAARLYSTRVGGIAGGRFLLQKRIPMGAGLGGGSSDAVAALRAVNLATGGRATETQLSALSAEIGSDCPLFFSAGPVVMRGRGERIQALPEPAAKRLSGRRLLLFKPSFGISTPWAYRTLAAGAPGSYLAPELAEARLTDWIFNESGSAENLRFNSFEGPAFLKFPALPALLDELRQRFGTATLMSGSGSACFAWMQHDTDPSPWIAMIRNAWGSDAFILPTRIA